jgi:GH15 family glucan-1,4-alpha-glucosidase
LLLPTVGLIDPRDPRFVSTVEAYERLLVEDGLMLRYLGNFPQAYTHVGLINTAVTLSELIEVRDARFRAWS